MALLDRTLARLLPAVPKPVVQKLSARYIAGPSLADASRVVAGQNAAGKLATIDVLGEDVSDPAGAEATLAAYREVLDEIDRLGLDANISVKPTSVGLKISYETCLRQLDELAARGTFVRVEMEDSSCTDETLRLYRELREAGRENVGIVLQSYLRRTLADAAALAPLRPNVRLVKGIYVEPPELAFQEFEAVRACFVRVLDELLGAGAYAAVATHDEWLVEEALRLAGKHGVPGDGFEFQLLLGVREDLGDRLAREGHRVRTYVPFGRDWYPYSLRRLQENPKMAGYVVADVLGRLIPGRA